VGSNSVLVSGRGYCTTDGDSGQWRWNPMLSRAQPVLALMEGKQKCNLGSTCNLVP